MKVTTDDVVRVMRAVASDDLGDEVHMDDLAEHCGVSQATMRRNLDDLVYQKKVLKVSPMIYALND